VRLPGRSNVLPIVLASSFPLEEARPVGFGNPLGVELFLELGQRRTLRGNGVNVLVQLWGFRQFADQRSALRAT
jgi:hypothetical protein